jgi:hypothetical protein
MVTLEPQLDGFIPSKLNYFLLSVNLGELFKEKHLERLGLN